MIGENVKQLRQETLADDLGISGDELQKMPRAEQITRIQDMIYEERCIAPGTFARVTEYLENVLKDSPEDADALATLAMLYNHRANNDREIASCYAARALEKDPDDKNNAMDEYLIANNGLSGTEWHENHSAVIRYFQSFLKKNPKHFAGTFTLIVNLLADFRYEEAERCIEELRGHYQYYSLKGNLAFLRGDFSNALELWMRASQEFPTVWQAYDSLGDGYRKLGRFEDALLAHEKGFSVQNAPRYCDSLDSKAQIYELMGNYHAAIEEHQRAVRCIREEHGVTSGEELDYELQEIERLRQAAREED